MVEAGGWPGEWLGSWKVMLNSTELLFLLTFGTLLRCVGSHSAAYLIDIGGVGECGD